MKTSHRLSLLALLAAVSLGTAAAQTATTTPPSTPPPPPADGTQPPPPPHGDMKDRMAKRMEEMTKELNLTQAQQDQIKAIMADAGKETKALFDDKSLAEDDRKAKMKDIHEATHEKIRAVLTPDQQKTFDEMKEKHHTPPPAQ